MLPKPSQRSKKAQSKDSAVPRWYVTELQLMRKDMDLNAQVLQNLSSAVCLFQRRISEVTDSLTRRIETLERSKESRISQDRETNVPWKTQRGWCQDAIGRLDILQPSIDALQECLHSCRSDNIAQTTALTPTQKLHTRDYGAPEACFQNDPSHNMCLEKLKEKWSELQTTSGGTEQFDEIASSASTMTILQVGKGDPVFASQSGLEPGVFLGSVTCSGDDRAPITVAASAFGHKAAALQVRAACRVAQQSMLDSVLQRAEACDGGVRIVAEADTGEAFANEECPFFSSKLMPCSQVKQEVLAGEEPVNPQAPLGTHCSEMMLPRYQKMMTPSKGP